MRSIGRLRDSIRPDDGIDDDDDAAAEDDADEDDDDVCLLVLPPVDSEFDLGYDLWNIFCALVRRVTAYGEGGTTETNGEGPNVITSYIAPSLQ